MANQWTDGIGDALESNAIHSAITLPGPLAGPERGWVYLAGLDLGLSRDASALVVVGKHVGYQSRVCRPKRKLCGPLSAMVDLGLLEVDPSGDGPEYKHYPGTGRLKLAAVRVWQPEPGKKIQLEQVESEILANISGSSWLDWVSIPGSANLGPTAEQATAVGSPVNFTGGNLLQMAQATLDVFRERQIDLFDDPYLTADLRALRVIEKGYGYRLDSQRGGERRNAPRRHCDCFRSSVPHCAEIPGI